MNISNLVIVLNRLTKKKVSFIMTKNTSKSVTKTVQTSEVAVDKIEQVVDNTVAQQNVTVTQSVTVLTKADKARTIFKEAYSMSPVPQRKDIINRMVVEAGLTKAGAATYLQNMKTKAGLVVARPKSTAPSA